MITITTDATAEPVTLSEAKEWLGVTGTTHDVRLTGTIAAARRKVEQLTGRSLAVKTYKLVLDDYIGTYITLPYPPITSISSVKTTDQSGTVTTVAVTDYTLVNNRLYFIGTGESVTVAYVTAGAAEEFHKLAIKKQLAYDFRNEFTENGFDLEVINMLKTDTLNLL